VTERGICRADIAGHVARVTDRRANRPEDYRDPRVDATTSGTFCQMMPEPQKNAPQNAPGQTDS